MPVVDLARQVRYSLPQIVPFWGTAFLHNQRVLLYADRARELPQLILRLPGFHIGNCGTNAGQIAGALGLISH